MTLHNALEEKLEADRRLRKEAASSPSAAGSSSSQVGNDQSLPNTLVNLSEAPSHSTMASGKSENEEGYEPDIVEPYDTLEPIAPASCAQDLSSNEQKYIFADLQTGLFPADPGQFYSEEYIRRLSLMIDHVIDVEGPIHEEVLVRRIARHHGFQRAGHQIYKIVTELAKKRRGRTKEDGVLFFWRKGTVKDRTAPARYEGRDDDMQKIEYICGEEIQAIKRALASADTLEVARRLGIARLSQSSRERLDRY